MDTVAEGKQQTFDRRALEALLARDYPGLKLLLVRRARDEALAADLLNEAVATAWQKWQAGQIAEPQLICGFVFQVAMNLLRNHRRSLGERADRRAELDSLDQLPGYSSSPESEATTDSIAARVKQFLERMGTARDRLILKRFYLDEQDKPSICQELQLAPDQFDKVLHRARGRLRELIEGSGLGRSDFLSLVLA